MQIKSWLHLTDEVHSYLILNKWEFKLDIILTLLSTSLEGSGLGYKGQTHIK
jgi:hypothetical protein